MKKCNTELMKELSSIQSEINELVATIEKYSIITYYEGEEVYRDFDFDSSIKKLDSLRDEERKIKSLLAYSNATTILKDYDSKTTIAEGLVKLAQFTKRLQLLSKLNVKERIVKKLIPASYSEQNDKFKITECMYDISVIPAKIKELKKEISRLQVAIDRTNLTNMIEC